ncbi:hypothetical protein FHS55_003257 [Angulomicrobium tetraedrale]|uniref:Tlde1 domain-containing protein n=1 Tax=Ancylobacter tetraedralis TaxID=217068 RepID=A0A839ZD93_9HYPH|nr:DUF2778 domain-containing protein [Ancylobacter tetraedralis]MBB3772636.1 hypothetical protein [Ancylobacter tetraedralis]
MRFVGTFLIGSASFVAMAVAAAWVSNAFLPTRADAARVDPELQLRPAVPAVTTEVVDGPAPAPVHTVMDVRNFRAAGEIGQPDGWLFNPALTPTRPTVMAALPAAPPTSPPTVETVSAVPLPMANPLYAGRVMPGDEPEDTLTLAPLPPKKPLLPLAAAPTAASTSASASAELAMLPPTMEEDIAPDEPSTPPAAAPPEVSDELRLPTAGDKYAIYDIRAKKLYMPGGKKLEAHSGYGDKFDDPRHVAVKMLGPTPPNRYKLTMREARFHGVEAVRMTPIGDGKMYGRNGILVHPYMLGPRGDSNGCVSVAEYETFLAAFKRGQVNEMIVVESMPKTSTPSNSLISWLTGKRG